jgi:hypothetical protein
MKFTLVTSAIPQEIDQNFGASLDVSQLIFCDTQYMAQQGRSRATAENSAAMQGSIVAKKLVHCTDARRRYALDN